jgi:hypothetical protein
MVGQREGWRFGSTERESDRSGNSQAKKDLVQSLVMVGSLIAT